MKTIYNTYIEVASQEQADRLKQICLENDLPIWNDEIAFEMTFSKQEKSFFIYNENDKEFFVIDLPIDETPMETQVTESEWLELLKQH